MKLYKHALVALVLEGALRFRKKERKINAQADLVAAVEKRIKRHVRGLYIALNHLRPDASGEAARSSQTPNWWWRLPFLQTSPEKDREAGAVQPCGVHRL